MNILKIILISAGFLVLLAIGLLFGSICYYSWQDSKFYNIEIPEGENFQKSSPRGYININCLYKSAGWSVGFISNPTSLYYEDFKSDRQIVFF